MMAFYTTTTAATSSFRSTTTIHNACSRFILLFVVLLSTLAVNNNNNNVGVVNADTIFTEIMPTKCVNPALNKAGFCVLTHECTSTRGCFESSNIRQSAPTSTTGTTTANTNRLSLDIEGFYIPVDAVDCEQFEDPMCPSTICCPECQVELNELYTCFITETAGLNYLDYLASTCPLDCIGYGSESGSSGSGSIVPVPAPVLVLVPAPVPAVTTTAPVPVPVPAPVPAVTTTAPFPAPVLVLVPAPVPAVTTTAPVPAPVPASVPVGSTIAPVPSPVPVATTIAPVPAVVTPTLKPFTTIDLVDPDTSNSTTYLGFGELILEGEDDVVIFEEEIMTSSNITTSEKVRITDVAADIP